MIPKVIHYCWFGRKPLPSSARRCIRSWKKYFPDYEIKEWNEDNFDVNAVPYIKEAYAMRRYAFVSDYARFWILFKHGGIYFDTDVEVIRPMDDIIEKGSFMGCETEAKEDIPLYVAPGLGIGCEAGNPLYMDLLSIYDGLHFCDSSGKENLKTIVQYTTERLSSSGLRQVNEIQCLENVNIYPKEYFNPFDYESGKFVLTQNTRTIHYFAGSWKTPKERFMEFIEKHFGGKAVRFIHRMKQLLLG